jgi:hypothetical protein
VYFSLQLERISSVHRGELQDIVLSDITGYAAKCAVLSGTKPASWTQHHVSLKTALQCVLLQVASI